MASRLWQAVTPEPQYMTASPGARLVEQPFEMRPQRLRRQHRPVAGEVLLEEVVQRAGNVAGDAVDGFRAPLEALRPPRVDERTSGLAQVRDDLVELDATIAAAPTA